MSEELENSLSESIQNYLDQRLGVIDERLAKLQAAFNEALAEVRADASTPAGQDSALSSVITAHLQAAREQKLSGVTAAPAPPPDVSGLRRGIDELKDQRTQSDVLSILLRNAAHFADRAVLFVIKGDQAIAWRMCEARDRGDLQPVSGVAIPLNGNTVVGQAARSQSPQTASGTRSEDGVLIEQLRGEAQQLAALPLTVRGKVVAVLYADSAWPHQDAIQLDALEILTQVASMAVELASPRVARSVSAPAPAPAIQSAPPVEAEVASRVEAEAVPLEAAQPVVEAEPPQQSVEASQFEASPTQIEAEVQASPAEPPAPEVDSSEFETRAAEASAETPADVEPEHLVQPPPPPPVEAPVQTAVFTEQYTAPLGRARRYGMPEADLPVEVSEDERRLHNDARRFARLLVSEIKLYNEQKVSEGRNQGDIYDRLREDIDRSRQMYDKRVAPPVAARHDYFHQELVNTLAEGDAGKLGASYPGAAVAA